MRLSSRSLRLGFAALLGLSIIASAPGSPDAVVSAQPAVEQKVATSLGGGFGLMCASTDAGGQWCWGDSSSGTFANGTSGISGEVSLRRPSPVASTLSGVVESGGGCVRFDDNSVRCAGSDAVIEDGDGSFFSKPPWGSATGVSYGHAPSAQVVGPCARTLEGTVQCYGFDTWGNLGNGGPGWPGSGYADPPPSSSTAVTATGLSGVTDLAAGPCALKNDGTVWCWGFNQHGQVGNGDSGTTTYPCNAGTCTDSKYVNVPTRVVGLDDAVAVFGSCARRANGQVSCWGQNAGGRFNPSGDTDAITTAVDVPAFNGALDIAFSRQSICAIMSNRTVLCQGRGFLGDGQNSTTPSSAFALGISTAAEIESGYDVMCIRTTNGQVLCWGSNYAGQTGVGYTGPPVLTPSPVVGFGGEVPDTPLIAQLSLSPGVVQLVNGADGTPTARTVTATLTLSNISDQPIDNVVPPTLTASLELGDALGFAASGGPTPATIGTIPSGQNRTVSYQFQATGRGVFAARGTVPYTDPVDSASKSISVEGLVAVKTTETLFPLLPGRFFDYRSSEKTIDGVGQGGGFVDAKTVVEVPIAGRGQVAGDAGAVAVNVTVVRPSAQGFLTLFPCGEAQPKASSLNYAAGEVAGNSAVVKLGAGGKMCVYTEASVGLVIDVSGWFQANDAFDPINPARLLETRQGETTIDGVKAGGGRLAAGSTTEIPVAGRGGVSADADAVAINTTVVAPGAGGFVTLYPCDKERPNTSSLNYGNGGVAGNSGVVALSATGLLCLYTTAETHVILDVNSWIADTDEFGAVVPARIMETRPTEKTVDGVGQIGARLAAGSTTELPVIGRAGTDSAKTSAIAVNVTAIGPSGVGFVTLFPCGEPRPTTSSLNYAAGAVAGNTAIVKLGAAGKICVYTEAESHLVIDINSFWTG